MKIDRGIMKRKSDDNHCEESKTRRHPETTNCHPETTNCHPETTNCHPETTNCHPGLDPGPSTLTNNTIKNCVPASAGMTTGLRNDELCVGIISEPYHMQGMVKIKTFTSSPENICSLKCYDEKGNRLVIEQSTSRKGTYRVKGITTRTEAERAIGTKIYTKRDELPTIEEDEFYIEDLVNLPVLDEDGQRVGYVLACHNFGAGDIIEVMFENGARHCGIVIARRTKSDEAIHLDDASASSSHDMHDNGLPRFATLARNDGHTSEMYLFTRKNFPEVSKDRVVIAR